MNYIIIVSVLLVSCICISSSIGISYYAMNTSNVETTKPPVNVDYSTQWRCISGINVPIRLDSNGDVQCSSTDGINCLWDKKCDLSKLPSNLNPLTCGDPNVYKKWKTYGYEKKDHWCNKGFYALKKSDTPTPNHLV